MSNNRTFDKELFIDRDVALALFDCVLGRNPDQPWPLLPILTFIAPSGGGKLWLIKYLRGEKCSLPAGDVAIPHAYLNFTLPETSKTPLEILCDIRDQLQGQDDGQGNHLTFPRFDLGATIALTTSTNRNLLLQSRDELLRKLAAESRPIQSLVELAKMASNTAQVFLPAITISPIISLTLAILKLAIRVPPLLELILRLKCGPAWKWYQSRSTDLEMHTFASTQALK